MKKVFKISLCVLMLALIVFAATQTNYFHVLKNNNSSLKVNPASHSEQSLENSEVGKYEAPVYFTIFKFISNYLPFKETGEVSCNDKNLPAVSGAQSKA